MQFYWDGAYTVGWPSGLYIGVLGFQGAKPLFRPIVLAQAVSSLPVEPDIYDAVHSLKKASSSRPGIPTINQGLILSKQLFNVHLSINKY